MTMILIGMNSEYVVQVSDRRISSGSQIMEDEHGKSFSLTLPGFRFTVAFTGLATKGSFSTADWLMNTLVGIGKTESDPVKILERLAGALTHRFSTYVDIMTIPADQRKLIVTIAGYNYTAVPPEGVAAEISNTRSPNVFHVEFQSLRRPISKDWTFMGAFGNGAALDRSKIEEIRAALKNGAPPDSIKGMFVKEIRRMADDPRSGVTIGKQIDHVLIYSDPNVPVMGERLSAVVRPEFTMPGGVMIGPGGSVFAMKGLTVEPVNPDAAPLTVPRVHRNQPCPCGSTKRYRHCHGSKR
jgi:hypothetical protein